MRQTRLITRLVTTSFYTSSVYTYLRQIRSTVIKGAPYRFFVRANADFENLAMAQAFKNSTPKSRARSRSKMPTNMASKLLKFVYRKCCVDRLRFQNICRLNRRPQLSLLDVKEKYTRHAGVSTNEADFM